VALCEWRARRNIDLNQGFRLFFGAVRVLGFQLAADALLLEQQCVRHSWFARMHMLFLDAGGAAVAEPIAVSAAMDGVRRESIWSASQTTVF
jgi:hypothetical protein